MPGLIKNTRRAAKYALGGVAVALAWDTLTPAGVNQTTLDVTGKIPTVSADAQITRHEFEENTCMYSDNTTFGTNKYPKHMLGMKFAGRSNELNDTMKVLDLQRTTWALKTHTGECVMIGIQNGLTGEKDESGAGAGTDDFNGYDIVLSGGETMKALVITETFFNALAARLVAD